MIIKNARIVTFDNNKVIEKGFLKIKNGIIIAIESGNDFNLEINEEVIDAKGNIVMPGFICTHGHIYSAFARGMDLKGGSTSNFLEILQNLWWRLDKKLNYEDIYYSALVTIIDCIKSGVTCLFDHHASQCSIDGSLDVIEKAFCELGLRGNLCYEVSDRDGEEAALKGIQENVRFIRKISKGNSDMIKGLFGLHAAFTLSDKTLERISCEGGAIDAGYHVHVAEGQQDYEYVSKNYGMGVAERLNSYNIINNKSILAHCIHINHRDKELLKKANVIHNPESNMNNAVGYCDVIELIEKDVLVGLGSDGFSSNPFRAIDTCYVLHKHEKRNPNAMSPKQVIDLAIINNGKIASKYYENPVGILKEGAKADVIILDYESPTPIYSGNIYGHIVFGMNTNNVTHSIINGKLIMKNREIIGIDEKEVYHKSRELALKLWNRF